MNQEQDPERLVPPKLSRKVVPLTDPRVLEKLTSSYAIMLHDHDRQTFKKRGGHYKARRDDQGWHIRIGKRGTIKEYLTACEITFDHGTPILFQFRTKEGLLPCVTA